MLVRDTGAASASPIAKCSPDSGTGVRAVLRPCAPLHRSKRSSSPGKSIAPTMNRRRSASLCHPGWVVDHLRISVRPHLAWAHFTTPIVPPKGMTPGHLRIRAPTWPPNYSSGVRAIPATTGAVRPRGSVSRAMRRRPHACWSKPAGSRHSEWTPPDRLWALPGFIVRRIAAGKNVAGVRESHGIGSASPAWRDADRAADENRRRLGRAGPGRGAGS